MILEVSRMKLKWEMNMVLNGMETDGRGNAGRRKKYLDYVSTGKRAMLQRSYSAVMEPSVMGMHRTARLGSSRFLSHY